VPRFLAGQEIENRHQQTRHSRAMERIALPTLEATRSSKQRPQVRREASARMS
jgi:hypothetical protein